MMIHLFLPPALRSLHSAQGKGLFVRAFLRSLFALSFLALPASGSVLTCLGSGFTQVGLTHRSTRACGPTPTGFLWPSCHKFYSNLRKSMSAKPKRSLFLEVVCFFVTNQPIYLPKDQHTQPHLPPTCMSRCYL